MKQTLSYFGINVKDMKKAIFFYKDKLGLKVLYQTPLWSELELNKNITLALRKNTKPGSYIGYDVDNCEKVTKELEKKGVKISTRCQKREKDKVILTQFRDINNNLIWLSQKI